MRKVLVLHNRYRTLGGEDIAVDSEIVLLKKFYEVKELIFSNEITHPISQTISFFTNKNKKSINSLIEQLDNFKPDVVYVHNTWFKASPGIFKILEDREIKTIIKLHNFRYDCTRHFSIKKHLNGNKKCPSCGLGRNKFFINKYFKDSLLKSIFILIYGLRYFQIISSDKNIIFVLTNFHKKYIKKIITGLNSVHVYPNYIKNVRKNQVKKNKKNEIIYAGRISSEKGVEQLIIAFKKSELKNFKLKIVGTGPDEKILRQKYSSSNILFLGEIRNELVLDLISESMAVVTATKLYEGQPTLLCEASLLGIPSIFPRAGGISEFFPENTLLSFEQNNVNDLTKKMNLLLDKNIIDKEGINNYSNISEYLDEEKLINKFDSVISSE